MKSALLLAPLAFAATPLAQAGGEATNPDLLHSDTKYITDVVTHLTTFYPSATVITMGGHTRTVTEATTLTILDCSCTVTKPVTSTITCTTTPTTTPTTTTTSSEKTTYYTTCTDAPPSPSSPSPSPSSSTCTDTPPSPSPSPSSSSPTCLPPTTTTPVPPTSSDPLPTSKCSTETAHQGGVTSAPTGAGSGTTTFSQVSTGAANVFGGRGWEGGVVGVVVAVLVVVVV